MPALLVRFARAELVGCRTFEIGCEEVAFDKRWRLVFRRRGVAVLDLTAFHEQFVECRRYVSREFCACRCVGKIHSEGCSVM